MLEFPIPKQQIGPRKFMNSNIVLQAYLNVYHTS